MAQDESGSGKCCGPGTSDVFGSEIKGREGVNRTL
jgi:hypothetical protein